MRYLEYFEGYNDYSGDYSYYWLVPLDDRIDSVSDIIEDQLIKKDMRLMKTKLHEFLKTVKSFKDNSDYKYYNNFIYVGYKSSHTFWDFAFYNDKNIFEDCGFEYLGEVLVTPEELEMLKFNL